MKKARLPVLTAPDIVKSLIARSRRAVPGNGDRFGRLTVMGEFGYVVSRLPRLTVLCSCECGGEPRHQYVQYLRSGKAKSCGCVFRELTEAKKNAPRGPHVADDPIYVIWAGMKQRCDDPGADSYKYYGARGITVCAEWRRSFRAFRDWSLANGYRPGLSIDRHPNQSGNYEPENCRWATAIEQARNMRNNVLLTAFGETKNVTAWVEDARCRVADKTIYDRMYKGWDHEAALTTPARVEMTAFGVTKPLKEWASDSRCMVSYKVLWQRINMNGYAPEDAISLEPHGPRKSANPPKYTAAPPVA